MSITFKRRSTLCRWCCAWGCGCAGRRAGPQPAHAAAVAVAVRRRPCRCCRPSCGWRCWDTAGAGGGEAWSCAAGGWSPAAGGGHSAMTAITTILVYNVMMLHYTAVAQRRWPHSRAARHSRCAAVTVGPVPCHTRVLRHGPRHTPVQSTRAKHTTTYCEAGGIGE